jgi:hypothetical protein
LHYIFELKQKQSYFWIIILAFNVALSLYWSTAMYNSWQQNPLVITVVPSTIDVKDIHFPSVTICPDGVYRTGVKVAFYKHYLKVIENIL